MGLTLSLRGHYQETAKQLGMKLTYAQSVSQQYHP